MAQVSQGRQAVNRRQTTYTDKAYVHGNAARKLQPVNVPQQTPVKRLSHTARKNRDKAIHMSLPYVLFLAVALVVAGYVLIGYIKIQSEITSALKTIASKDIELNTLRTGNADEYNRIISSIDLEEVKRIAIEELGMTYAQEGQVVTISGEGSDYVRQYCEIP